MAIRITGISSNMDTDAMVEELVSAYKTKGEKTEKAQTKLGWKQEAWEALNTKIKNFYSKTLNNMRFSTNYNKKATTVSDTTKATVVASDNAVNGTQSLEVKNLAKPAYLTGGTLSTSSGTTLSASSTLADLGYTGGTTTITVNKGAQKSDGTYDTVSFELSADTKISDFTKYMSSAGYNANFDSSSGRIFVGSKNSGASNNFDFVLDSQDAVDALGSLGMLNETDVTASGYTPSNSSTPYGVKIDGESAKIILNGAEFTSNTNTFTINGLTVTAKELTADNSSISLITDTDYDTIYNNIKSFFKEYNSLINEMDALYNADSAKGYEPLTDEEKEAMTETEVEQWEEKVKGALLRRDDTLSNVSGMMREAMLETYKINGKVYSLSSFGINTLGYFDSADNEKNAYHINGDSDDSDTFGEKDKLKAAIASDPSTVATFFQNLTSGMYNSLSKKISRSDKYSSFGSVYDDKKMQSDYDDYTEKIADWEDYVEEIEERYYKQFSAMETALSKLNSQQTAFTNMLGG
ncbi:MAG: flagellar filament capping protein FliD [Lachnospiraceae bacterium]